MRTILTEDVAARLSLLFDENFARHGELGAAVSIWQDGRSVLERHSGFRDAGREQPWTSETLVLFWSATKGLSSACLLHVLQENSIELGQRVAEFWPEFAQSGKDRITLAQLLSHQAGLAAIDKPADITDYPGVIRALEQQTPLWPPGTAHGYHARTFGFLVDELVRRIDGRALGIYWRDEFAKPLKLDIWIGLPESENKRSATVYAAKAAGQSTDPFYRVLTTPGTLQSRVFASPHGLQAVSAMNHPENRARSLGSLGGIGSGAALAKFYAMLANEGELDGTRFFLPSTIAQMTTTLAAGPDLVLLLSTAFSAGFMKDPPMAEPRIFGPSPLAFGHPGAGGSHAFADPENRISFAYVMNQMEQQILPNEKSLRLVTELYR